jgi:alpha-tubulin suppressor-like RCC1 family protein
LGAEPGEFDFNTVPEEVIGGLTFQSIDAGAIHTCGVAIDESAYCWGSGRNGRLGDGNDTGGMLPVEVIGGLAFSSISAGQEHTCGSTTGGIVYCWGSNFNGQLGILELGDFDTPQLVIGQPG